MKSMLLEASSVMKAIEKAWSDSGKPREFTIKILEEGKKNFLGFSKRPAIISIAFDPRKVTAEQSKISSVSRGGARQGEKGRYEQQRGGLNKGPRKDFGKPMPQQQHQKTKDRDFDREKRASVQTSTIIEDNGWTDALVEDIKNILKETLSVIGISVSFSTKVDKKTLQILFNESLLDKADDERQLFASLSYLSIQLLKKKHKKKFKGYQIILTSKKHGLQGKQDPLANG